VTDARDGPAFTQDHHVQHDEFVTFALEPVVDACLESVPIALAA